MATVTFTVPGPPKGKGRARAVSIGGHARMYPDAKTATYERQVGTIALPLFPVPIQGPVRLNLTAVFEIPKSRAKGKRALRDGEWHAQRPDLDNIEKAIKDGLNRIAWADDCQVADVVKRKFWGHPAGVIVTVETLP